MAPVHKEPRRPATYEDILAAPPHRVAEILDGELVLSPRPAPAHAYTASTIVAEVGTAFGRGSGGGEGRPGGWWILSEPELHMGQAVVVPDLAGWRRERMPRLPRTAYFTLAPDWICEVLSPGTQRVDRLVKMHLYARERVGHLWLVDPLAQTLEVFALRDGLWTRLRAAGGDETVWAEPFQEMELHLADWWAALEPEPNGGSGSPTSAGEQG